MITLKSKKIIAIILGVISALCFLMFGLSFVDTNAEVVQYEKGKVEVYQIAPEKNTLTQGYVIKTANDKIVVIDGGVDSKKLDTYLPQTIRQILGKEEGEAFHVDAWFLSHPHNDHIFELAKMLNGYVAEDDASLIDGKVVIKVPNSLNNPTEYTDVCVTPDNNFTIGKFYFDFPTWNYKSGDTSACLINLKQGLEKYAAAHPEVEDFTLTNGAVDVYSELNGKYINKDTIAQGQNIYVDGVRFEILQTWSFGDGDANNNSMIIRMWVDGQSLMFLNDAGVKSGNRLLATYDADFLKADIVQLAHHGQNGVSKEVYDAIDADVRLWANFYDLWNADVATTANQTADVRTWFGLNKFMESTETDFVAALSKFPVNPSVQADWTEEVLNSQKITLPYVVAFKDDLGFKMNEGATLRLNEGSYNAGLRFSARMTAYDEDATYGFVIAPKEYFEEYTGDYALNLLKNNSTKPVINLLSKVLDGGERGNGNYYEIQASISNIMYKNMNREFTGLAYIYKDGQYIDAEFTSLDAISTSVLQAALDAERNEEYTGDDLDVVNTFIHKGLMSAKGVAESDYDKDASVDVTLAFTETTANVKYGNSVTLDLQTNVSKNIIGYEYDEKLLDFDASTGKVTPKEIGEATITAYCYDKTATFTVNTTVEEGYYTVFNAPGTLKDITLNDRAYRTASDISVDLATNVKDRAGVTEPYAAKITVTSSISDNSISDILFTLPREVDVTKGGVTIAINIAETQGTFAIFNVHRWATNAETGKPLFDAIDPVSYSTKGQRLFTDATQKEAALNLWKYIYVDFTTATAALDKLALAFSGMPSGTESVVYVAYIAEGDVSAEKTAAAQEQLMDGLRNSLTDDYIAQFDNELYKSLVTVQSSSYYFEGGMKVDLVDEFQGEKGVLKISGIINTVNGQIIAKIKMPKAYTQKFTVKFYVVGKEYNGSDCVAPGLLGFCNGSDNSYVSGGHWYNSAALEPNVWHTKTVTPTAAEDAIYFMAGWSKGFELEAYISFVIDGDGVNTLMKEYKAQALENLNTEAGEIASFNCDAYTQMLSYPSSYAAKSYSAEMVESVTDGQGITMKDVMKLTINLNTSSPNWSFVNINLPKAHTGLYTLEYYIPEQGINFPADAQVGMLNETASLVEHDWQKVGVWTSYVCDPSNASGVMAIGLVNHPMSGLTFEIYISAVYDGDKTAYVNEKIYKTGLGENEIANFDIVGYTNFVVMTNASYNPGNFKVEWLESYGEGENQANGVIKISGKVNSTGNRANVGIQLIVPHTGTYTIKYAWGKYTHSDGTTTSLAAGRWMTGVSDACVSSDNLHELKAPSDGVVWQTSVVDTSSWTTGTKYVGIQFWGSAVTLTDTTTENCGFVMYIDCIYNGDVTQA